MTVTKQKRAPVFFVSHGAGPFAILRAPHQQGLLDLCEETSWILDDVKGVIVITAHWLTDKPTISSAANPPIYCDYFDVPGDPLPQAAWDIVYDAPGDTKAAHRIKESFDKNGLDAILDDERGWDHGVWTPMMLMRPQADLPIIQVSIPQGKDIPERAIAWGKALEPFRDEGWAICGSGHTWHNFDAIIGAIMGVPGAPHPPLNRAFEDKLEEVVSIKDTKKRLEEIAAWKKNFPDAEEAQPTGSDEHFTPFLMSMGAAGDDVGRKLGEWGMFGIVSSNYVWE